MAYDRKIQVQLRRRRPWRRMRRLKLRRTDMTKLRKAIFRLFGWAENYCDSTDEAGMFVRFTNRCPNRCRFCIERNCDRSWKNVSGSELARITNESGRKYVSIGGGEPCLDMDRLVEYVEGVDSSVTLTYLVTSLPKQCEDRLEDFEKVIRRVGLVDIASHGVTNREDEAVFGSRLGYDKQAFIHRLALKYPDKVYVSCVMRKSAFRDFNDLLARAGYYYALGVRHLYLNEMCLDVPFERDPDFVSIDDLFAASGMKRFGSAFTHTCKLDISGYFEKSLPGLEVKVRRRCFRCGSGLKTTWGDVFKTLVNALTLRRQATPVLNNNGLVTDWYPAAKR